ncbi:hypothetical protein NG726_03140 [Pseudomonas sp. MOB-449]|nr:hypothetical protein [Pseudomonas sp. MOB-449]
MDGTQKMAPPVGGSVKPTELAKMFIRQQIQTADTHAAGGDLAQFIGYAAAGRRAAFPC